MENNQIDNEGHPQPATRNQMQLVYDTMTNAETSPPCCAAVEENKGLPFASIFPVSEAEKFQCARVMCGTGIASVCRGAHSTSQHNLWLLTVVGALDKGGLPQFSRTKRSQGRPRSLEQYTNHILCTKRYRSSQCTGEPRSYTRRRC